MDARPLRIALLAPSRYPIAPPLAGGLESLVWHLRRALVEAGHDVTLIARRGSDGGEPGWSLDGGRWNPSELAASDGSMPALEFMTEHHAYLRALLDLGRAPRMRFDVVHNHSLHYLPVAMASTLSAPLVTTLHTPPTPWLESSIDAGNDATGYFTAVSEHTARSWSRLDRPPRVVRNGVDLRRWRLGPGGDGLLWSGRMTPEKAPHLAIAAARRAGLPLVLAGPISNPDYFASMVSPWLGGDVRYVGHLAPEELAPLVGRADAVLVTPLWDEPFGLVVAEALACGTPVVAFARGGIPEVLASKSLGVLVPPGDFAAMGNAARSVAALDRRRIRAHAARYLSLDAMVSEYLDVYRALAHSTPARSIA